MLVTKNSGFTLLEMLVAVAIFSVLVILAMTTFARSIASSVRIAQEREQTEETRSVFDQIVNDTNYLAINNNVSLKGLGCQFIQETTYKLENGYMICNGGEKIQFLLRYPGTTSYVFREYEIDSEGNHGRKTVFMKEKRDCSSSAVCNVSDLTRTDLLSKKFSLVTETGSNRVFSEIPRTQASRFSINIRITTRPNANTAVSNTSNCLGTGLCYTLSTTVVPGGGI